MIPADEQDVVRALTHITTLGRMYAIRTDRDPRDELLDAVCDDKKSMGTRLTTVGVSLGTKEPRVAASSVQYELAERLWAIQIAMWSHHQLIVDLSAVCVGSTTGSWSLATWRPLVWRSPNAAGEIARAVLKRLSALHRTIRSHTSIAEGLLWGNAATAATLALSGIKDGQARVRAIALVTELLCLEPLRHRLDGPVDGAITRRSCCLYYRTRDPRPCGDCPLRSSTVARLAAQSETPR